MGYSGADRDRTDDLHNAIVALFQLSYGPETDEKKCDRPHSRSIVNCFERLDRTFR